MSDSADDIVKRMQHLRRQVSHDVKGIVQSAKTLTDWRYHVRHHPWMCAGLALGVGYFLVPRRQKLQTSEARELAELLKKYKVHVNPPQSANAGGLLRALIGVAAPAIARTAMNIAQNRFAAMNSAGFAPDTGEDSSRPQSHVPR